MDRPTWDETFLEICDVIAKRSKDESTKFGCVIVGDSNEILSVGYNCFPRGINDNYPERQKRPAKYHYFCHSERNAIYNAARNGIKLNGSKLYVQSCPCSDCARAIIQVGIKDVILKTNNVPDRWKDSCHISRTMFMESNVFIRSIQCPNNCKNMIVKLDDHHITNCDFCNPRIQNTYDILNMPYENYP